MNRFVDLHRHVLWGLDDGPQSRGEMFALLRRNAEQGIGTIAATPHVLPGVHPFNRTSAHDGGGLSVFLGKEKQSCACAVHYTGSACLRRELLRISQESAS